ncbi:hypothetical protein MJG53_012590 [Ovis ammon polii x Ovis aries]|uniref:Uncharacterized protein n=2 Tax=Ovis TaxID=9935 RepID=A0A836CUG0_SHEEP|nr:hypothetical protein JEQ12_007653 [Ovis aries]KAI4559999.1 hypothetical protein MJT46_012237 [Ovis ammon polii x Ovis aries]KAI4572752.1 hypothetical protein MJG53_012590 [Ovis ammon polii x Ovis aries]
MSRGPGNPALVERAPLNCFRGGDGDLSALEAPCGLAAVHPAVLADKCPTILKWTKENMEDLPGGPVVGNLPANAGDTASIPSPGRSHMPQGI